MLKVPCHRGWNYYMYYDLLHILCKYTVELETYTMVCDSASPVMDLKREIQVEHKLQTKRYLPDGEAFTQAY
jgi:hypothetical protein